MLAPFKKELGKGRPQIKSGTQEKIFRNIKFAQAVSRDTSRREGGGGDIYILVGVTMLSESCEIERKREH